MLKLRFLGNTRIPHHKGTAAMSPVRMTPPAQVLISLEQHIGAPAVPVVKVGDTVKVGQLIAEAGGYVSSPIYSSVSGTVTKIEPQLRFSGKTVDAIRIESDGQMEAYEGIVPPTVTDADSLLNAVRASGVVGLGGAGFPTAVKFDALKKGCIHTIILNGAECEPYITSDARTMLDDSAWMVEGVELLQRYFPEVKNYIIGIEANKPECIHKMTETFNGNAAVSVRSLPVRYPQGAEKVIIYNTTGLIVPEGKLPADVGVLVTNVTTLTAIAKYVKTGMPLVERCVTVDGSAIRNPQNVIVPIGTAIQDIIDFAGGFSQDPGKIILGGPMTGSAVYSLDEPTLKTTGSIIALSPKDSVDLPISPCIHCGRCVDACPLSLVPTAFLKAMDMENTDERMAFLDEHSLNLCMSCGCCSFVCPANRPLTENIRMAKTLLKDYKAHKASLK